MSEGKRLSFKDKVGGRRSLPPATGEHRDRLISFVGQTLENDSYWDNTRRQSPVSIFTTDMINLIGGSKTRFPMLINSRFTESSPFEYDENKDRPQRQNRLELLNSQF